MINIHTHIFNDKNVPDRFLPFFLVRILIKFNLTNNLARFLHNLNPANSNDTFDRYANFICENNKKSAEEIFQKLKSYYPQNWGFVALSMDFEFMKAGNSKQGFFSQLNDLYLLKQKYGSQIFPFIAVDPRRENLLQIVKDFIETKKGSGIKIYPPLGFYPFDERLYPIYEYAESEQIPIISHCSRGGVYYRGKITKNDLKHPKTNEIHKRSRNKNFAQNWTNPKNWEYVLKDFPNLRLDLAHFGGEQDWKDYTSEKKPITDDNWIEKILFLIEKYQNVYTDISYTLSDRNCIKILVDFLKKPKYREKILFGSDFYMDEVEVDEKHFSAYLVDALGSELYNQISNINNKKFLKIK